VYAYVAFLSVYTYVIFFFPTEGNFPLNTHINGQYRIVITYITFTGKSNSVITKYNGARLLSLHVLLWLQCRYELSNCVCIDM